METAKGVNFYQLLRIARDKEVNVLAEELNVTPAYIHAIESGNQTPTKGLIRGYSRVLNVDKEIILDFSKNHSELKGFEKFLLWLLKLICK